MQRTNSSSPQIRHISTIVLSAAIGVTLGAIGSRSMAQMSAPTEHKGLSVETLGKVSENSVKSQVSLDGHILLMRAITIEPGGQIKKHSHGKVPGLVTVISGEWTEGRDTGEMKFDSKSKNAIIEDKDTVHWFYNRGNEPATAIVCDIRSAS